MSRPTYQTIKKGGIMTYSRKSCCWRRICASAPFWARSLSTCVLHGGASGAYAVIDFRAVLFGYAMSGEHTLEAFYERLQPFAGPFMALFERDQLPARSTLSRFLAALTPEPVEALRTLFLDDLESRPLSTDSNEKQTGGLVDRAGNTWVVFDIDG